MATEMTIGDLRPFLELAKSNVLGIEINDFGLFFDKIESLLKSTGQWTDELAGQLGTAEKELTANPGLFQVGKDTFVKSVEDLLAKYPESTPLSQIPELSGDGGSQGGGGSGGEPPVGELPTVEGGHGIQIALVEALRDGVTVKFDPVTKVIDLDGAGVKVSLEGIDRIKFSDGTLAFDFDGVSGKVYRLYEAAFDRDPDKGGLKFWIEHMDDGMDLNETAARFVDSAEFRSLYGTDGTIENFVSHLYQNILGREGEKEGFDFWVNELQHGMSYARALIGFSESTENTQNVAGEIGDGIFF